MKKLAVLSLLCLTLAGPAIAARGVPADDAVAGGNNAFAVDLYRALADKPGNLFFSPYSVSSALEMVAEGAKGTTLEQMNATLRIPSGVAADGAKALRAKLAPGDVTERTEDGDRTVPAYEMSIANAVWAQKGLALVPAFPKTLESAYAAPLQRIDFTETAAARKIINDWVAGKTKDRIRDIVPEGLPTPDTLLALANAIHFKAAWKDPFSERFTRDGTFTTGAGAKVDTAFMHRTGTYGYLETDTARAVEIPYRAETSMVLVVPDEPDGLRALDWADLNSILGRIHPATVALAMPKFSFTFARDLSEVLPGMGMTDAFVGGKADFTGITTEEPLMIGPVLHKAFIAVDEAGTEAAAATVVMMIRGGPPADPVEFSADRPFLFLIRHRDTGTILFCGRVDDPTAK